MDTAELFQKARPRLLIMARVAGIPSQDCEDIVQEALAAAFIELSRGRPPARSGFGTWLRGITNHKIQDYWRRKKRSTDRFTPPSIESPGRAEMSLIELLPAKQVDQDVLLSVREALDCLPAPERYILQLSDTAG